MILLPGRVCFGANIRHIGTLVTTGARSPADETASLVIAIVVSRRHTPCSRANTRVVSWFLFFFLSVANVECAASRFGNSNLHQRDSRSALFEGYTGSGADNGRRPVSTSPNRPGAGGGYGYGYPGGSGTPGAAGGGHLGGVENRAYRPATPNSRYVALAGRWH